MADKDYIQALTSKFAAQRQKQADLSSAYWRTSSGEFSPFTNSVAHMLGRGLASPDIFSSPGMVPDDQAGLGQTAVQNAGDFLAAYLAGRGAGLGVGAVRDSFRNTRNQPAIGLTARDFKTMPLGDVLDRAVVRPSAGKPLLEVLGLGDSVASSLGGRLTRPKYRAFAGRGIPERQPWFNRFNPFIVPVNDAFNAIMDQYSPDRSADDRITVQNIHPHAEREKEKGKGKNKGKTKLPPLGPFSNELLNSIDAVSQSTPNVSVHRQNMAQRLLSLVPGGNRVGGVTQTNLDMRRTIPQNQANARQRTGRRGGALATGALAAFNFLDHNSPFAPATRGATKEEYEAQKKK